MAEGLHRPGLVLQMPSAHTWRQRTALRLPAAVRAACLATHLANRSLSWMLSSSIRLYLLPLGSSSSDLQHAKQEANGAGQTKSMAGCFTTLYPLARSSTSGPVIQNSNQKRRSVSWGTWVQICAQSTRYSD